MLVDCQKYICFLILHELIDTLSRDMDTRYHISWTISRKMTVILSNLRDIPSIRRESDTMQVEEYHGHLTRVPRSLSSCELSITPHVGDALDGQVRCNAGVQWWHIYPRVEGLVRMLRRRFEASFSVVNVHFPDCSSPAPFTTHNLVPIKELCTRYVQK
jgi:hypothetical protein